jgi:hypothetical protein
MRLLAQELTERRPVGRQKSVQSRCWFVDVVESAEDRSDNDAALPVPERRRGSLQAEAAMWATVVVVVDELAQDRAQVTLAEGS